MSAPASANRRYTGSRRINPLKVIQPKQRLQQILVSSPVPVPKPASSAPPGSASAAEAFPVVTPPSFDYCKFIELDYVPMETGFMVSMRPTKGYASTKSPTKGYTLAKSPDHHISRTSNSPSTPCSRRTPSLPSNRDPYGNTSHSGSSNSSSCKGSDCSPTKGRHQKYTSCTDNHGIRPPPPEQYLTPLQQKEVCIRHLRARLKETVDRLQDRDSEIDELRVQLSRMQEDWVEEECHRVEAQLALKEARREIQQLKHAVDTVRSSLSGAGAGGDGVHKYFQDINTQNLKLENLLLNMELAQNSVARGGVGAPGRRVRVGGSAPASVSGESPGGTTRPPAGGRGSCSCDGSPARSLTRSSTYTKLSDQVADEPDLARLSGEGTRDSGFVCCGEGGAVPTQADLLLEAAFLSEETASLLNSYAHTLPHSSTYEKLAPYRCALGGVGSISHPCLSHHHLYLHHLRETGIQTESCPAPAAGGCPSDLDTIAEQRTVRSQACSPSSTWLSDVWEDELDSTAATTSVTTPGVVTRATVSLPAPPPHSDSSAGARREGEEKQESEGKEKETVKPGLVEELSMEADFEVSDVFEADSLDWVEVGRAGGRKVVKNVAVEEELDRKWEDLGESRAKCLGAAVHYGIEVEEGRSQPEAPAGVPSSSVLSPGGVRTPCTSQPRRSTSNEEVTVVELRDDDEAEYEEGAESERRLSSTPVSGTVQKSYWSRHFLIDLLAVAVPVVPTVAWLCRGPARVGQPMYHIGALLRGCCTVALHSLRRGGGLRHYPAGGGDLGGTQI